MRVQMLKYCYKRYTHGLPPIPDLLCNIIYIQSKSYVNVYISLKEILLKSHEIMFISVNWHWIKKYCNVPPSTACIITSNQLEWNALVFVLHTLHNNIADSVRLTQLRKSCYILLTFNDIRMVGAIILNDQQSSYCYRSCSNSLSCYK